MPPRTGDCRCIATPSCLQHVLERSCAPQRLNSADLVAERSPAPQETTTPDPSDPQQFRGSRQRLAPDSSSPLLSHLPAVLRTTPESSCCRPWPPSPPNRPPNSSAHPAIFACPP